MNKRVDSLLIDVDLVVREDPDQDPDPDPGAIKLESLGLGSGMLPRPEQRTSSIETSMRLVNAALTPLCWYVIVPLI